MNELVTAAAVRLHAALPDGAWDIGSFLENARSTAEGWGGLALMLGGTILLIWGAIMVIRKLTAGPQTSQQIGWGKSIAAILVGGALASGGFVLVSAIGSGGQKTIEELGGTVILSLFG